MYFDAVTAVFCVAVDDFDGGVWGELVFVNEVEFVIPEDETGVCGVVLYGEAL